MMLPETGTDRAAKKKELVASRNAVPQCVKPRSLSTSGQGPEASDKCEGHPGQAFHLAIKQIAMPRDMPALLPSTKPPLFAYTEQPH